LRMIASVCVRARVSVLVYDNQTRLLCGGPSPTAYVNANAAQDSGRTGAQRLRIVVGHAVWVRVEVDTASDSVPKAAGRVVRVRPVFTIHLAPDAGRAFTFLLFVKPAIVHRAKDAAGIA
jgi:hypothetical protein